MSGTSDFLLNKTQNVVAQTLGLINAIDSDACSFKYSAWHEFFVAYYLAEQFNNGPLTIEAISIFDKCMNDTGFYNSVWLAAGLLGTTTLFKNGNTALLQLFNQFPHDNKEIMPLMLLCASESSKLPPEVQSPICAYINQLLVDLIENNEDFDNNGILLLQRLNREVLHHSEYLLLDKYLTGNDLQKFTRTLHLLTRISFCTPELIQQIHRVAAAHESDQNLRVQITILWRHILYTKNPAANFLEEVADVESSEIRAAIVEPIIHAFEQRVWPMEVDNLKFLSRILIEPEKPEQFRIAVIAPLTEYVLMQLKKFPSPLNGDYSEVVIKILTQVIESGDQSKGYTTTIMQAAARALIEIYQASPTTKKALHTQFQAWKTDLKLPIEVKALLQEILQGETSTDHHVNNHTLFARRYVKNEPVNTSNRAPYRSTN